MLVARAGGAAADAARARGRADHARRPRGAESRAPSCAVSRTGWAIDRLALRAPGGTAASIDQAVMRSRRAAGGAEARFRRSGSAGGLAAPAAASRSRAGEGRCARAAGWCWATDRVAIEQLQRRDRWRTRSTARCRWPAAAAGRAPRRQLKAERLDLDAATELAACARRAARRLAGRGAALARPRARRTGRANAAAAAIAARLRAGPHHAGAVARRRAGSAAGRGFRGARSPIGHRLSSTSARRRRRCGGSPIAWRRWRRPSRRG